MTAKRIAYFVLASSLMAPLSQAALAQSATSGTIAGVVKDTSGAVLPGVTVEAASPALIEKVRTAVTDDQGNYKITELRPGNYTVRFTLPGFATLSREGLELSVGFTASVNAEMKVGTLEETVTVTTESPVVDVQNTRTQTVLSREVLDALPTFKSLGGFIALTLSGANPGTQDVGGNKGESVFAMNIHGSRAGDLRWKTDGMDWGSHILNGQIRTHRQNTVAIQEVVVEAGGSAENETGGAQLNYIPRDGGNRLNVYGFSNYTNENLQSQNLSDDLKARGLTATPGVQTIWDHGIGVGGPIKEDRLWFYSSNRWWGGSEYQPGAYFNKTVGTLFYTPDLDRQVASTANWAKDFGGRLTYQATVKHKFTYSHHLQRNCNCVSGATATTSPEASVNSDNYWNQVVQGSWSYPATNKMLFAAGGTVGYFPQSSHLVLGTTPQTIGIRELSTGLLYNARASLGGITDYGESRRRMNINQRFSVSYVTGSHAFKTGVQAVQGIGDENSYIPNDLTYQFRNNVPASIIEWASPWVYRTRIASYAFYVQDQWTMKRLTLNYGLRYDQFRGWTLPEDLPATRSVTALVCAGSTNPPCEEAQVPTGRFAGARSFAKIDDVPNFQDLSPRLGAVYDLFGNGKTAIKGSIHRYVGGLGVGLTQSVHPALAIVSSATRTWNDSFFPAGDPRNGNYVPDCDLQNPLSNAECAQINNLAFGTPVINTRRADDVTTGFGNREYSWAASATVQHELRPGFALNFGYYRTWFGNFVVTDNILVAPPDYDPYCITSPVDSRLPGGGGDPVCGLYDLQFAKFGQVNNLVSAASEFGEQTEHYNSFDLGFNTRFGRGGFLSGGVSLSRTTTHCVVVDSPQIGEQPGFCEVTPPWSAGTQVQA